MMAFRILEISHPAELHTQRGELRVIQPEHDELKIPLDDLYAISLIGPGISVSSLALSDIASRGIAVVCCNRQYMPEALSLPLVANSRQSAVIEKQITASDSFNGLLWQRIVRSKIENQARALTLLGLPGFDEILNLSDSVLLGDSSNVEGEAARRYFKEYMPSLSRREETPVNSALNYCYAIVRTTMARSLVATGFLCAKGLHHANQFNPYNLADDLMEPFRPTVDLLVKEIEPQRLLLSQKERKQLLEVLFYEVALNGKTVTVAHAIDLQVESLNYAIGCTDETKLLLPQVIAPKVADIFER